MFRHYYAYFGEYFKLAIAHLSYACELNSSIALDIRTFQSVGPALKFP